VEPLLKYWPSVVGVFALALFGTLLWPSDEGISRDPAASGSTTFKRPTTDAGPPAEDEGDKPLVPLSLKPRIVVEEVSVPTLQESDPGRTLRPEDQDVQAALSSVEIELYKAPWCSQCVKAEEFLTHNHLNFRTHDVESDVMVKEKARRLSGQTGIPVIVIDGDVTVGFSESMLSKRLSTAVERRVREPTE
jgi:glutaredoxin